MKIVNIHTVANKLNLGFLLLTLSLTSTGLAQGNTSSKGSQSSLPKVMILGVYHMANPGQDVHNPTSVDVLTPQKQEEIAAVIDSLVKFGPTKIAIEGVPSNAPHYDSLYSAYQTGDHQLSRNERQQLGFRLANRFDHEQLYPIDFRNDWPYEAVKSFAQEHEQSFLTYFEQWGEKLISKGDSLGKHATVSEKLEWHNSPQYLGKRREAVARQATVGNNSEYPGVDLTANWYRRNLRIFANIENIADQGDHIIVIFGAGHAPLLRDFVEASPQMKLVDPLDYL